MAMDSRFTLTHMGADNLRALRMPQPASLRRLTLLVGQNGVGKSTFLRVFPLLRQSVGMQTREPLLWWANDGVDFGRFQESLRRGAQEIGLSFWLNGQDGPRLVATLVAGGQGSRLCRVRLERSRGVWLELHLQEDGRVEGLKAQMGDGLSPVESIGVDAVARDWLGLEARVEPWDLFGTAGLSWLGNPLDTHLLALTRDLFHGNTVDFRRLEVLRALPSSSDEGALEYLRRQRFGEAYKKNLTRLAADAGWLRRLRQAHFAAQHMEEANQWSHALDGFASRTAWLGPFRALPERSYRPQSVAVEVLDPQGANLVMFLNALTPGERADLNAFLRDSLGFTVKVEPEGAHLALRVALDEPTGSREYNLVDVGFGYSQVLPVLVQVWASAQRLAHSRAFASLDMLCIEQPELHLHPTHQAGLARVLARAAQRDRSPMLLIETHSDHLVAEVGREVARGHLDPDRVVILLAEPHPEGGASLREATFDEEGYLHNWPSGFMAP